MATTWEMNYLKVQQKCGNTFQDKDNDGDYFLSLKHNDQFGVVIFVGSFFRLLEGRGGGAAEKRQTNVLT